MSRSALMAPAGLAVLYVGAALAWLPSAAHGQAPVREVNVALSRWATTAVASSVYRPGYEARNATDGRWASRETDKWNSVAGPGPHWIVIDLGRPRMLRRVVIRHEGVYGEGDAYNTRDFRIQRGETQAGPWTDLVPPVRGNVRNVTEHRFAPIAVRYLAVVVTKGERSSNEFARIFEIEAYADIKTLTTPLVAVDAPSQYRWNGGKLEQMVRVQVVSPDPAAGKVPATIALGDRESYPLAPADAAGVRLAWVPAPPAESTVVAAVTLRGSRQPAVDRRYVTLRPAGAALGGAQFPAYFAGGTVHVITSSHQDIAWMNTPQRCIEQRDRQVITPALDRMRRDPEFRFVMEDTLSLMEYLHRHPERRAEVLQRTREGRLEWGGTYNEPYESLQSGESLVRQVLYGRRWLQGALPGCDARVAWSPDVPGRAMQMPQILSKAGVRYLVISRQTPGVFRWQSPDGSSVVAYSPGHYVNAWDRLQGPVDKVAANVAADLAAWEPWYREHGAPPDYGYLLSTDAASPADISTLQAAWPRVTGGTAVYPTLRTSTSQEFLERMARSTQLPSVRGERPNVWLYIHGPTHHQAISAKREAARLLPAAEAFSVFDALLRRSFGRYPARELAAAWQAEIYPDHGWGGYYGEITDGVFAAKLTSARDTARRVLGSALRSIAGRVRAPQPGAQRLIVFNTLSWTRSDVVTAGVRLPRGLSRGATIRDDAGRPVTAQWTVGKRGPGGSVETATAVFVARDVPAYGYRAYALVPAATGFGAALAPRRAPAVIATSHYRVTLAPGGVRAIYDRDLRRDLLRTDRFLGGELFTMQSVGNGAGEFAEVQQPTMEEFDRLSAHQPAWKLVEAGPVRTVVELGVPQSAAQFRHCSVRQRVTVYRDVKRIDFETRLIGWDGTPYREFRVAFPVSGSPAKVSYEVPMGVVEVGKSEIAGAAGERYTQPCSQVHPREVQNWIGADGDGYGVTISSSVAVADYIDPTSASTAYPVLQPVLLASRRSCHGLGNWYLQAGDHEFRFSLTSHPGDWRSGWRAGVSANAPLTAVQATGSGGTLPTRMSFLAATGAGVQVTAVKKAEDGDNVVVRTCEMNGARTPLRLSLFRPASTATATDLLERGARKVRTRSGAIEMVAEPYSIDTVRLRSR